MIFYNNLFISYSTVHTYSLKAFFSVLHVKSTDLATFLSIFIFLLFCLFLIILKKGNYVYKGSGIRKNNSFNASHCTVGWEILYQGSSQTRQTRTPKEKLQYDLYKHLSKVRIECAVNTTTQWQWPLYQLIKTLGTGPQKIY